jgi:predicted transcriptional regulator of viral defense system
MIHTTSEKVLAAVRESGMIRARDLAKQGISPTHLQRLYEKGLLLRSGRGIYLPADVDELNENDSLREATLRIPAGVVCLLSALQFHGLTTQVPHQVWLALPARANSPRGGYPRLRIVHMSEEALTAGIEPHQFGHTTVKIFCAAKTAVDCFKFRNKIGLDVALEALRDCWAKRRANIDEIWHYAKICRVSNVMRPYLESIAV